MRNTKHTLIIMILFMSFNVFSQQLKTFSGAFNDNRVQNGIATYTYYEDPVTHDYLKQGAFKYNFIGKGDYIGFDEIITGTFEKGLKTGTWTYTIMMKDFGTNNPYSTGTVTLSANYKNGYADGTWKEIRSYKDRKKYFTNGQYKWEAYTPLKTMTIVMNFKDGRLNGNVNINDEFANFKATGNFDNNSLCTGTWMINDVNWNKNRELIYKDNTLYEFIIRDNSGKVLEGSTKYEKSYADLEKAKSMSAKEREDAGLSIDTLCGGGSCPATNGIQEYFNKLQNKEYFLYEYIGGDLSYEKGFTGGCELGVRTTNFTSLIDNLDFKNAENYYGKNDLLRAYELYTKIDVNTLKPSERGAVSDKIALIRPKLNDLVKSIFADNKQLWDYFNMQNDSLSNDFSSYVKNFKLVVDQKILNSNTNDLAVNNKMDEYRRVKNYESNYEKMSEQPCWSLNTGDNTKKCFMNYREFYNPFQIAITQYYIKFKEALKNEERNASSTSYNFSFENTNYVLYSYDKSRLINIVREYKRDYEAAKSTMQLSEKCNELYKQIETLNDQNRKKCLYSKYQLVYDSYWSKYNAYNNLQETLETLNSLISFSNRVVILYTQDTDGLEKQLKSIDSVEEIKKIISGL